MSKELNIRVVTEVLGYEKLPSPAIPAFRKPAENGLFDFLWDLSDYSGNIGDAWKVVGVLELRGYLLDTLSNMSGHWYCEFCNKHGVTYGLAREQPTAPLAICMAALDLAEKIRVKP